jgi:ribosome-associated toxin RatA of RatAB toxin-antitoxin module
MRKIQCPFPAVPAVAALLCLWAAFSAWADDEIYAQGIERGVQLSDEIMPNGRTAVRAVFRVDADPDTVYRTVCDVTHFPEFMPNTRAASVLAAGAGFQVVRFSGGSGWVRGDVTLRRLMNDAERRISWTLVEGRPRAVNGFWHVERGPGGQGSLVTYSNDVDLGAWVPDALVKSFVRSGLSDMVVSLRKRVASGGTWRSPEYLKRVNHRG